MHSLVMNLVSKCWTDEFDEHRWQDVRKEYSLESCGDVHLVATYLL